MFAIRCPYPYCLHENKPGARFCADCGAPLHLKPCAKCGKVDDVTAKVCSSCNAPFPPIKLAEYASADATQAPPSPVKDIPTDTKAGAPTAPGQVKSSTHGAMPLIVIALFAGGVPLLWMNRGHIPTPGSLGSEVGNANVTAPPSAPYSPPLVTPPQVIPPSITESGPAIQALSPTIAAPTPATTSATAAPATVTTSTPPVTPAAVTTSTPPVTPATVTPSSRPVAPATAKAQPKRTAGNSKSKPEEPSKPVASEKSPRSCTDAVAALGLCDEAPGAK